MTRRFVILPTLALSAAMLTTTTTSTVLAQRLLVDGAIGLGTGLERSDDLGGFRRARTRLVVDVDGRVDEDMGQGFGLRGFAEIEPHSSGGIEGRYIRWIGAKSNVFAGVLGVLAPKSLVGADVGIQLHIPFGKKPSSLFIEPAFAILPLGSDLPEDRVLFWGLLTVGIHGPI